MPMFRQSQLPKCKVCGDYIPQHFARCSVCEAYVCGDCIIDGMCELCFSEAYADEQAQVGLLNDQ